MIVADAMKRANSVEPAKYLPEVGKTRLDGVTAKLAFDEFGDLKGGAISIYKYEGGKLAYVETLGGSPAVEEAKAAVKDAAGEAKEAVAEVKGAAQAVAGAATAVGTEAVKAGADAAIRQRDSNQCRHYGSWRQRWTGAVSWRLGLHTRPLGQGQLQWRPQRFPGQRAELHHSSCLDRHYPGRQYGLLRASTPAGTR